METTKEKFKKFGNVFVLLLIFSGLSFFSFAFGSTTDGTIDSAYKYAWCNNTGWLNFSTTNGNVHITDSGITGYVWDENYGWINMGATKSGVEVSDAGALSGSAWGENVGWIDFSGTSINCSGQFTGTATGDYVGTITFSCTNCSVITDYRPQACRSLGCTDCGPPPPIPPECGNGICSWDENCFSCTSDCGSCFSVCGDKTCNGYETCTNCPQDCGTCKPVCGDKKCESPEDCSSCPSDCGTCNLPPQCGDKTCNGDETCTNCPQDCGTCMPVCGDKTCNGDENCKSCPSDCGVCPPICGDKTCNGDETCTNCPQDCGTCMPVCGDKKCEGPENCGNCPSDCGKCKEEPTCGDGFCKDDENCKNCPQDCGTCLLPPCGNGACDGSETCKNCPNDCGECKVIPPNPPIIPHVVIPPVVDIIIKIITTAGAALMAIAIIIAPPISLAELFLLPARLMGLLLIAFGWKKRNPPWGIVYDSITKQPLDPAYVLLKDSLGNPVSSAITDLDGRYGFLIEPGIYKMTANKTNYIFPSQKLAGKTKDELYDNLYFGGPVEIKRDEVVTRNIPLDPLKFDWNEFTKQNRSMTKFYSRWDLLLREVSDFIYFIGFIIAIIAFFAAPYPYNTIILGLYLFLLALRILGIKPKAFGSVIEKATGTPSAFAILRVTDPSSNREISQRVTDKYGRYFCLVPKGQYYVKIEKKNEDGSYSLAYTSPVINALKNGIIKNKFKI
jgi:hypothetical protein